MKTVALLAALLVAATPASAAERKRAPAVRAKAAKKAAAPPEANASTAPAPVSPRAEATLAASGLALSEEADGLLAALAWPDGPAAASGLLPGDRVWRVNRAAPATRAEAAAAIGAQAPEGRLALVVRRGLEILLLTGAPTHTPPDFVRGARDLSAREKVLAAARASRDDAAARDAVAETAPLDWTLRADQAFWVRFPDGLPAGLRRGDEVAAEVATGLTTDGALDFLAVPPKSRVWARVLSVSDDGEVRAARLVFYKLRPAGGRTYPILGAAVALADVSAADHARVSAGGTLVAVVPLPSSDGKNRRGKDRLLDEYARLRVRLVDPVLLSESPSWWRAGPGLWLKTASDASGRRRFQVTHVVAGRSAAAHGLKVGDLLDAVGGRSAERLNFEEALDALYGPPGTKVNVSVARAGGSSVLELTRGVKDDAKGARTPLSLPFETR
jgi:hypothetical protein